MSVKLNDVTGPYFVSSKGVRQGDPLSPILFNFVADCMARMVRKAQNESLIMGLASNIILKGVVLLQYADDTIVCLQNNIDYARNMKLLLYFYEMMSGLKINFSKSEVITIHGDDQLDMLYADLFNCQIGRFPLKYLGVPVSPGRLHIKDWLPLVEKNEKKLATWKGSSMSIAGRVTLINSSLSNALIYHMSMFLLPKTIVKNLDKQRRRFFWQGGGRKRKYHLVKWTTICKSKKKGGLGVKDISKMNISLLCKWWWKLEMENGLWQDIVKAKYLSNDLISSAKWRLTDSPVWKDLLQVRPVYLRGRAIKNGNGTKTLFWKDPWIDPNPLCSMHPVLFEICTEKYISVHTFLLRHGHIDFHRWLSPILFEQWLGVVDRVYSFPFTNESDRIIWKWNKKSGLFTTKSTYDWLTSGDAGMHFRHIWKAKIPYKIKIFVWLLEQNAILTKDNMIKRNWVGDPTCFFCSLPETRDHLFFECVVAKVVWGVIGRCFGADNTPRGLTQYKDWIRWWMPSGGTFHTFGRAAVCWAFWKYRNKACFD